MTHCGTLCALLFSGLRSWVRTAADEPKPTPENTISVRLAEPVPAQKSFWRGSVISFDTV